MATIAHQSFQLDAPMIEAAVQDVLPEPLGDHFVVISSRRYPPKQVLALATGLDRADFNTHQARNILRRMGFTVGRRNPRPAIDTRRPGPHHGQEADALRPYAGQWVAQRGLEILVAADSPQIVLSWLEQHGQHADAMFKVPSDEAEASGLAPA
jgi:hypothetical protein